MSNQAYNKNNFTQNNLNTTKTALNNVTGSSANRLLSAKLNKSIKHQVNNNLNLKKLNQNSHSDSSNSFIRQVNLYFLIVVTISEKN